MNQNILMIGHFATKKDMNDGQTVKTRNLYQELINARKKVEIIDTQNWKNRIYRFFKELIKKFFRSDKIILIVASNGAKVLIPILMIFSNFHHVEIYYCTIGSWVDERVKNNKILNYYCKKLNLILVETEELEKNLKVMGYNNVKKMYNFKRIASIQKNKTQYQYGHFCTFSRVREEKGIEDAISVINYLNNKREEKLYLDIYGPIEEEYKSKFFNLMNKQNEYIRYMGNVKPEESINYISQYYMLLFPTKYIKEGLPGTLIDAYTSGVPVIASNWNSAKEFVKEKETGFIYEFKNKEDLKHKIIYALDNRIEIENMRNKCKEFSYKFTPQKAIEPLLNAINNSRTTK